MSLESGSVSVVIFVPSIIYVVYLYIKVNRACRTHVLFVLNKRMHTCVNESMSDSGADASTLDN